MKHSIAITFLLLGMFLFTQILGLVVINAYQTPVEQTIFNETTQRFENVTAPPELPYGMQPPEMKPQDAFTSIVISIIIATLILLFLVKKNARLLLRLWFFSVVLLAIAIVFNAGLSKIFPGTREIQLLAVIIALPLAFHKIFLRNILVHNLTELLIYPGIAAVFVPILNVWAAIALLAAIAVYDVYAVWRSGFMQKLAKFQIEHLHVFTGFFVPYLGKKERIKIAKIRALAKKRKTKLRGVRVKVNLAILGGGDITFPLIFAGVVLKASGLMHAILIEAFAALALLLLFITAKKGKFYPAMLFLSPACIIAWFLGLLF